MPSLAKNYVAFSESKYRNFGANNIVLCGADGKIRALYILLRRMSHVCTYWCQELMQGKCIYGKEFLFKPTIPLSFLRKSTYTVNLDACANSCCRLAQSYPTLAQQGHMAHVVSRAGTVGWRSPHITFVPLQIWPRHLAP